MLVSASHRGGAAKYGMDNRRIVAGHRAWYDGRILRIGVKRELYEDVSGAAKRSL